MEYIDDKIKELEEIRNSENLSFRRSEKNEQVLNELCESLVSSSIAGKYFSKKVADHLAHSYFSSFSVVRSDDGLYYISDFGDELSFTNHKGTNYITYRTPDEKRSIKLYRVDNRAFIKTDNYTKEEDHIVSGSIRVYDLKKEPKFKKLKKYIVSKEDTKKSIIVDLLHYNNETLFNGVYCTTIDGDTKTEFKCEKIVDPSRYEMLNGELFIIEEDSSKLIEKNSATLAKLLRF